VGHVGSCQDLRQAHAERKSLIQRKRTQQTRIEKYLQPILITYLGKGDHLSPRQGELSPWQGEGSPQQGKYHRGAPKRGARSRPGRETCPAQAHPGCCAVRGFGRLGGPEWRRRRLRRSRSCSCTRFAALWGPLGARRQARRVSPGVDDIAPVRRSRLTGGPKPRSRLRAMLTSRSRKTSTVRGDLPEGGGRLCLKAPSGIVRRA